MSVSPLPRRAMAVKRALDVGVSALGLLAAGPLVLVLVAVARADTGASGLFRQERVGRDGRRFTLLKIRTMRSVEGLDTVVTTRNDPRITRFGALLRRLKLDELPQLWNILRGDMSLVGPRPDVPGFADRLVGEDRIVLSVRPGLTGPATLAFRNEESLLAAQPDPEAYNRDVLFPAKVRLNREYVEQYSLLRDCRYLYETLRGFRSSGP